MVHCRERKKKIGGWRLLAFMNDLLSIVWLQKIIVEYPQLLYFTSVNRYLESLPKVLLYLPLSLYIYIFIYMPPTNTP